MAIHPGDIAFVGVNSTNPDQFAFVALNAIAAGDIIYFTDGGYTGATSGAASAYFQTTEGFLQYTAPSEGIAAGSVLLINAGNTSTLNSSSLSPSVSRNGGGAAGTVTLLPNNQTPAATTNFTFGTDGESLTAYTVTGGTHLTGTPTLVAFVDFGVNPYVTPPNAALIISEVAAYSSSSPVGQDWFEVTNTGSAAIDISGWKVDDNSFGSPSTAQAALSGIASIAAGETVIFIEAPTTATADQKNTLINLFKTNWFGSSSNAPTGLQIGTYSGSGVGLSSNGDAVVLFNSSGTVQARVDFGASASSPFKTFDNATGINSTSTTTAATISTFSAAGVNGAFAAANNSNNEIGSPGRVGLTSPSSSIPTITGGQVLDLSNFDNAIFTNASNVALQTISELSTASNFSQQETTAFNLSTLGLPSITLAVAPASVTEDGTTNLLYTFTRTGPTTNALTVNYSVGGSASNGNDYGSIGTSVTFDAGSATATVTVDPAADAVIEVDETVALTLAIDTGYTIGTTGAVTGTITNDDVPPTIAISSNVTSLKAGETATLTFTLSEASSTFTEADVSVSGGTLSNFSGSGASYTATFTPNADSTANGVISVASGTFLNAAGNTNTDGGDANNTVTLTVGTLLPTIAISSDVSSLKAGETATLSFSLSEASTDFTEADVSVSGGTLSNFSGSGTSYTATFTPNADSTANGVISVASGTFLNAAGNTNTDGGDANNTVTLTVDTAAPTVTITDSDAGIVNIGDGSVTFTFTFTEAVSGFDDSKVTVGNGTKGTFTAVSSSEYTLVVTPNDATSGVITVDVSTTGVSDAAGNPATAPAQYTQAFDTAAPLFISGPTPVGVSNIRFITDENAQAALYNTDNTLLFPTGVTANTPATLTLVAQAAITAATLKIVDGAGNFTSAAATFRLGTSSDDLVNGTSTADLLYGFAGNDTLSGGTGNDTLVGGEGTNSLNGGAGDDIFIVDTITNTITEDAGSGIDTVRSSVTFTLGSNLENLTLTGSAAINGTGNLLNNVITGNGANNVLNGSTGIDTLIGGLGNDTYVVDSITDTISEDVDAGIDTVKSSVNYTLGTNLEKLTLTGVAAINGTGNTLNNTLTGNGANNILNGGIGLDYLNGGAGVDTLIGGLGDDTYVVDSTTDTITEDLEAGIDLVQSTVTYTLGANLEKLTLKGTTAIDGTGNTLNNVITGNGVNNILNGGEGIDTLIGGLGDDTYIVDSTTDTITEAAGAGIDTVQSSVTFTLGSTLDNLTLTGSTAINGTGNTLSNVISGNVSNNLLSGGTGNDSLDGGAGNDTLIGGAGTDNLTGGAGTDRFQFVLADSRLTASNNTTFSGDTITDYAFGTDVVDGPTAVTAANMASRTLSALATYTDSSISSALTANLTTSGTTAWAANRSALVTFGAGDTAQTFLVLGDATAGYQATGDAVFRFQFTGTLANFAIV